MTKQNPSARITLGRRGEDLAGEYLVAKGYTLLTANWRYGREGELDLIMLKPTERLVVVVEVKTRRSDKLGSPLETISTAKRRQLMLLSEVFLAQHPQYQEWSLRCDLVGIQWGGGGAHRVMHVENAFQTDG